MRTVGFVSPDRLPPFAVLLREFRRGAGLTQEELARAAGVGVRTLRDLETGRATRPQRSTVELLATALELVGAGREDFLEAARGRAARRTAAVATAPLRPVPPLVGRDDLVRDIAALLDVAPMVTLVGLAGIGKTVLALTVGHQVGPRFPGGVGGLAITEASTEAEIVASAMSALRVRRVTELAARFQAGPTLLLFDGADRSPKHAAAAWERLRGYGPQVHVLATSRHPLGVPEEHEWPVPPLDMPPPTAQGEAVFEFAATRLFVERLRRVRRHPIGLAEAEILGALVRRLGGVPLALELAAARGRVLELGEILARCEDDASDGEPAGHQLRSAVRASWDLLSPAEQACLCSLATLQWRWSIDLAEEILAGTAPGVDVVALVDRLVALGLVSQRADSTEPRFWLLDAVRELALERAAAQGTLPAARDRHAVVMAALAARTTAALTRGDAGAAERRLDGLVPDLYAAMEHLRQRTSGAPGGPVDDLRAELEHCQAILRNSSLRWHDLRGLAPEEAAPGPTTAS